MKFHTNISREQDGTHFIRGKPLLELIEKHTFTDIVFLLLRGNLPSMAEKALLDAVLVAVAEHGIAVPSLFVPRVSYSVGNDLHVALAAGLLATGSKHGGAAEAAAEFFLQPGTPEELVAVAFEDKKIIPGFGHKVYKEEDPRVTVLYNRTRDLHLPLKEFDRAYAIEKEIEKRKGKKLPLNIDGGIAVALMTLQLRSDAGRAIFLFGRMAGMTAHILEERDQNNAYYRLDDYEIEQA